MKPDLGQKLTTLALIVSAYVFVLTPTAFASGQPGGCTNSMSHFASHLLQQFEKLNIEDFCAGPSYSIDLGPTETEVNLTIDTSALPDIGSETFYGLATYYNKPQIFGFDLAGAPVPVDSDPSDSHDFGWLVFSDRFDLLALQFNGSVIKADENRISVTWPPGSHLFINVLNITKTEASNRTPPFDIKYAHLWDWLAALSRGIEALLHILHDSTVKNWGLSIFLLAMALKTALLPAALLTVRYQKQVSKYQAMLQPELEHIKTSFRGQEAHERIMATHKNLDISPFFTLKPMIGTIIQIPVLIAVFTVMGESQALENASFLWITNLSAPDSIGQWPFAIPGFGEKISALPFIMAFVSILSTMLLQGPYATEQQFRRQKLNLYFMAVVFFVLFYPFPAAVVLYWTFANLLQCVQQKLIHV